MRQGWVATDYVELNPDALRPYSKEYRLCLSGAHAAKLDSVQEKYKDRMVAKT